MGSPRKGRQVQVLCRRNECRLNHAKRFLIPASHWTLSSLAISLIEYYSRCGSVLKKQFALAQKNTVQRLRSRGSFQSLSFCHGDNEGSSDQSRVYLAHTASRRGNSVLDFMETKDDLLHSMFSYEGNSARFEVYVGWISKSCCWRWNLIRHTETVISVTWGSLGFFFHNSEQICPH